MEDEQETQVAPCQPQTTIVEPSSIVKVEPTPELIGSDIAQTTTVAEEIQTNMAPSANQPGDQPPVAGEKTKAPRKKKGKMASTEEDPATKPEQIVEEVDIPA